MGKGIDINNKRNKERLGNHHVERKKEKGERHREGGRKVRIDVVIKLC